MATTHSPSGSLVVVGIDVVHHVVVGDVVVVVVFVVTGGAVVMRLVAVHGLITRLRVTDVVVVGSRVGLDV